MISLFVLGGRDRSPGPAYLLNSVLRYAAVKVPRGGSPGSRMLDFLESEAVKPDSYENLPRKEVIQPHLPVRLPCYDFTPIIYPTLGGWLLKGYLTDFGCYKLSWCDGRCVQGPGTYSPRRADPRLLATPASRRRVAASDPNWGRLCGIRSPSRGRNPLYRPL